MANQLKTNTSTLQSVLEQINALPEAGGSSDEYLDDINAINGGIPATTMEGAVDNTETYVGGQADLISQIEAALDGKAAAVPVLQTKEITPTTSQQSVTPDSGYDGLSSVKVKAIPSTYVKPTTTKAATTYTPTTSNQTIAAGTYCSGVQTIKGDANLKAENIAEGVSIFGVTGTHSGGSGGGSIETCEITLINNSDDSYDCYGVWTDNGVDFLSYQAGVPDGESSTKTAMKNSFIIIPSSNVSAPDAHYIRNTSGISVVEIGNKNSITITMS